MCAARSLTRSARTLQDTTGKAVSEGMGGMADFAGPALDPATGRGDFTSEGMSGEATFDTSGTAGGAGGGLRDMGGVYSTPASGITQGMGQKDEDSDPARQYT
jgi:hypothetical protein